MGEEDPTKKNNKGNKTIHGHNRAGNKNRFFGRFKSFFVRHSDSDVSDSDVSDSDVSDSDESGSEDRDSDGSGGEDSGSDESGNKDGIDISVQIFPIKDEKVNKKLLNGTNVADIHITPQYKGKTYSSFVSVENQLSNIIDHSIHEANRLRGKDDDKNSDNRLEDMQKYMKNDETIFHIDIPHNANTGGTRKRPMKSTKSMKNINRRLDSNLQLLRRKYTVKNRRRFR